MALETEAKNIATGDTATTKSSGKAKENNNTAGGKKNQNPNPNQQNQNQNLVNGNGTAVDGPAAKKKGAFNFPPTPMHMSLPPNHPLFAALPRKLPQYFICRKSQSHNNFNIT